jgi:ribosomal protein L28
MKVCAISGRHSQSGRRTKHPHSGPWAHRAPAKARKYDVNLQTVTVPLPNGQKKKIKIAARMLTSRKFQAILDGRQPLPKLLK